MRSLPFSSFISHSIFYFSFVLSFSFYLSCIFPGLIFFFLIRSFSRIASYSVFFSFVCFHSSLRLHLFSLFFLDCSYSMLLLVYFLLVFISIFLFSTISFILADPLLTIHSLFMFFRSRTPLC